MSDQPCLHENAIPKDGRLPYRPAPDQRWPCPDCGENVGFSNGKLLTAREMNDLVSARQERLSEARVALLERQLGEATRALQVIVSMGEAFADTTAARRGAVHIAKSALARLSSGLDVPEREGTNDG